MKIKFASQNYTKGDIANGAANILQHVMSQSSTPCPFNFDSSEGDPVSDFWHQLTVITNNFVTQVSVPSSKPLTVSFAPRGIEKYTENEIKFSDAMVDFAFKLPARKSAPMQNLNRAVLFAQILGDTGYIIDKRDPDTLPKSRLKSVCNQVHFDVIISTDYEGNVVYSGEMPNFFRNFINTHYPHLLTDKLVPIDIDEALDIEEELPY